MATPSPSANTGRPRVPDIPPPSDTSMSSASTSKSFCVQVVVNHATSDAEEGTSPRTLISSSLMKVEIIKIHVRNSVDDLWFEITKAIKTTTDDGDNHNDQVMGITVDFDNRWPPTREVLAMYVYWGGVSPVGADKGTYTRVYDGNVEDILEYLYERRGCNDLIVMSVDP